jgi:glucokinase
MGRVCCIDVGGTTVKSGVLDKSGRLLDPESTPTPGTMGGDAGAVVDLVSALAIELTARHGAHAVGVVVPGIVDEARGLGVRSENLGWRDVAFRDILAERIGLPVAFGHDVRAGGLAETRLGAGRGHQNLLFLPIGTGIAAALVFDGRACSAGGWAGEIGHVDVGHGQACHCGLSGCLEAVSSGAAIVRRYTAKAGREVSGAAEVAELAERGDIVADAVWTEAIEGLAHALSWSAAVLAPEVIVLGGGLAGAGESRLLNPLRADLARRLSFHRVPELVPAALGERAGCVGAGLLALDLLDGRSAQ